MHNVYFSRFRFAALVRTWVFMDAQWFKHRQKAAKVTSHDLGEALGRDRTIVSRILNGRQRMSDDQVEVFAQMLQVDPETIREKAGLLEASFHRPLLRKTNSNARGFSEGEAVVWVPQDPQSPQAILRALGIEHEGVEIWRLATDLMDADGYRRNDFLAVDHSNNTEPRPGEVVIAQIYDNQLGTAETVVRRYAPPVLLTSHPSQIGRNVSVVDGRNVAIRGRVIASWRKSTI